MSQAKVDKYKQDKANRKELMKKEKAANTMRKAIVGVIAAALVVWVGYSAWNVYDSYQPKEAVEIDYSSIDNLSTDLTE